MFDVKNALASLCISGGLQHGLPKSCLGCCEALATQVDQACLLVVHTHWKCDFCAIVDVVPTAVLCCSQDPTTSWWVISEPVRGALAGIQKPAVSLDLVFKTSCLFKQGFVCAAQHIGNVSSASAFKTTASACGLLDVFTIVLCCAQDLTTSWCGICIPQSRWTCGHQDLLSSTRFL